MLNYHKYPIGGVNFTTTLPKKVSIVAPASGKISYFIMGVDGKFSVKVTCGDGFAASINDGRLNLHDLAAPVAIYNGYEVWAIDPSDGHGVLALSFPAADVPSEKPSEPVVLAEDTNPFTGAAITLYQLPSGELQVNTVDSNGKDYVFRW